MEVQRLLKLQLCVHFHLEESLKVEDYSLQVYNQDFRSLFDQCLLCYFLDPFVAVYTEVVRNLFSSY